ncbi:hypothetical protein [Caballeronia sp. KNU42]
MNDVVQPRFCGDASVDVHEATHGPQDDVVRAMRWDGCGSHGLSFLGWEESPCRIEIEEISDKLRDALNQVFD